MKPPSLATFLLSHTRLQELLGERLSASAGRNTASYRKSFGPDQSSSVRGTQKGRKPSHMAGCEAGGEPGPRRPRAPLETATWAFTKLSSVSDNARMRDSVCLDYDQSQKGGPSEERREFAPAPNQTEQNLRTNRKIERATPHDKIAMYLARKIMFCFVSYRPSLCVAFGLVSVSFSRVTVFLMSACVRFALRLLRRVLSL